MSSKRKQRRDSPRPSPHNRPTVVPPDRERRQPSSSGTSAPETPAQPPAPHSPSQPDRRKAIWHDFRLGLACTALLIVLNAALEHTRAGEQFRQVGYNLIQMRLADLRPDDLPVTVVDISSIHTVPVGSGPDAVAVTPRAALQTLIGALARQHPRAIGVDIDFSSDDGNYVTPDDPGFFQFCNETSAQVPVFLGVKRAESEPPDSRLGSEYYERLAADISIPRDDPRRLPSSFQPASVTQPFATMSAALASTADTHAAQHRSWLEWAAYLKPHPAPTDPSFRSVEYLVDLSPLDKLREDRLLAIDPQAIAAQKERIEGKILLLGDATPGQATDTFVLPNQNQPVPGVFLHACGVNTLVHAPLYELTPAGQVLIDLALSLAVFGTITGLRLWLAKRGNRTLAEERWQGGLTLAVIAAGLLFGVGLVYQTRIVWDDFLFVIAALLLHPTAHHWLHHAEESLHDFAGNGHDGHPAAPDATPKTHPEAPSHE